MEVKPWTLLSSRYLAENKWLKLRQDTVRFPDGRISEEYFIVERNDWATVFALTKENELVLVRHYKHGAGEVILELPAGGLEKGETPEQAAKREFLEETGYLIDSVEEMGDLYESPSDSNNHGYFFFAKNARKVGEPLEDPSEQCEVVLVKLKDIPEKIRRKEIRGCHSIAGIYFGLEKLREERE